MPNEEIIIRENPLLSRVRVPGETFTLPSRGLFYGNGELDDSVENGELTVNPMTAVDEITIRSPDKLFSGKGIVEVFAHCVPQVLKPLDLFAKDVDFLMCCLRKVSYGEEFEVSFVHDCEKAKNHSYVVPIVDLIKKAKRIDPTTFKSEVDLKFPNGQQAILQPIRYNNIINLMQTSGFDPNKQPTEDEIKKQFFEILISVVKKVDEIEDKTLIDEWLRAIPRDWAKKISDKVDKLQDWGANFEVKLPCKDCGQEVNVATQLNPVGFFI